jgi:hypothetical protein
MEKVTKITLPTKEEVRIEMIVEDIITKDERGFPVTIYDRRYAARYPDDSIVILHKENGIWRDDLNPADNGTTERMKELKTAILDHNL